MTMRSRVFSLLLVFFLVLPYSTSLAATITTDELTQLEQTFSELKRNNSILLSESDESKRDLIRALSLLKESQAELARLSILLAQLKAESTQAKDALSTANSELKQVSESFKAYEKEKQREIRKYQILSAVLLIGCGVLAVK